MAVAVATSFWEEAVRQFLEAAGKGDLTALARLMSISAEALLMEAADEGGVTALMHAAKTNQVETMELLLNHPSATPASMMLHTDASGLTGLMWAARKGHVEAMRLLLDHASADLAVMVMATNVDRRTALMFAATFGHVEAMHLLLDHSSVDGAVMVTATNSQRRTALMLTATFGHVEAMRLLLDHPSVDVAAAMMHTGTDGYNTFMEAAQHGHVDAMRLLLDHASADIAAAMMTRTRICGDTALVLANENGHVGAMRLLLYHASADPATTTVLEAAAGFAAGQKTFSPHALARSCAPLLFLLRRATVEPQPSEEQQADMTAVMEALCQVVEEEDEEGEPKEKVTLFDDDHPNDARDECIRLLIEFGADCFSLPRRAVVARIIRECVALARVPQLVNEAIVGIAVARQQQKPRDNA
ncbi:hypothetical protein FOA52_005145 [Chlamydomonas sp. UWO 241]|nr:hypothetical protein FOA52_005145 [Chlamydomonas sp. UWO 241]